VNAPTRAVKGFDWDGLECDWAKATFGYSAIHFHEDDLDDAQCENDFFSPFRRLRGMESTQCIVQPQAACAICLHFVYGLVMINPKRRLPFCWAPSLIPLMRTSIPYVQQYV
jgi:hypothetical protein